MDDWNDFGAVPPPNPRALPPPNTDYDHALPRSRTVSSVSDSSVPVLDDDNRSVTSSVSPPSISDTAASAAASSSTANHRDRSFIPSFPFLKPRRDRTNSVSDDSTPNGASSTRADRFLESPNDQISAGSESETHEPPTVRIPPTVYHTTLNPPVHVPNNYRDIEDPNPPPQPIKGDLDDVPDDFELGTDFPPMSSNSLESAPISSTLLRHPDRTFLKLEVISAKEVRSLLVFFGWFVIAAFLYTALLLLAANTTHAHNFEVFLDANLLTDQLRNKDSSRPVPPQEAQILLTLSSETRMSVPLTNYQSDYHCDRKLYTPEQCAMLQPRVLCENPNSAAFPCRLSAFPTLQRQEEGQQPDQTADDGATADGIDDTADNSQTSDENVADDVVAGADFPGGQLPNGIGNETPSQDEFGGGEVDPADAKYFFITANASVLPRSYQLVSHFQNVILSLFFFVLAILFGIRIFSEGRGKTTHEQVWVLLLLLWSSAYFSTVESIIRLVKQLNENVYDQFEDWVFRVEEVFTVIRETSFTLVSFFYLWANLQSYRVLDPLKRLTFRRFYLPKLLALLPITVFLAVSYLVIPVVVSEIPLMAAPVLAFYFGEFRIIPALKVELAAAIVKSLVDLILLVIIIREAKLTISVLENAPYMKYRTKRVGFRFFLFINFVFYILFFTLQLLLLFGKPRGDNYLTLSKLSIPLVRADVFHYWLVGPNILFTGYLLVTAYVHLPRTSVGIIKGWFVRSTLAKSSYSWSKKGEDDSDGLTSVAPSADDDITVSTIAKKALWSKDGNWMNSYDPSSSLDNDAELQQQIVEPVTYRMRESKDKLQVKANCFTMQTHVIMFNFAWYVYYYGTAKLDKFEPKENPLPFQFQIQAHATCTETDTQALVVDCTDRIIVTFKGTTSKKNVRTSLRMSHERLSTVIHSNADGDDESERLKKLFGTRYSYGKLHRGFAHAYLRIADQIVQNVQTLRERKMRPVFLTGHSLGGALATICSLDLWVKLNLSRREIFVSTFGSPRVGNRNFQIVYDQVVPLHWRIVVDPDMITKMPISGYTHVGKKVVLTAQGDMLIDRNALDRRPWTGEAAGFAYHRKAAYMLAMRAWCMRHHGMTYTPAFWPFPVRREDERRFAGAFEQVDSEEPSATANRIASINAMMDELGKTAEERVNKAVVDKWERLTRYTMLKHQLQASRRGGR
ncbi:hypothetical protein BWQ96_02517 [Gracilariopsis chorda]|uniref:Fungal lipase-type domain-containing protein n=1 Tax=Gracilariopsis chorda TaxID=448386 RepID=A0A2V3IZZ9_9FLOR|nr:hypothetical protein BWQ96_02517 [Gracilariopsis chorda]|eukprot:PXF47655.1 hypothetical protein BWQ96_02517 [Gracilariopsis chorda]